MKAFAAQSTFEFGPAGKVKVNPLSPSTFADQVSIDRKASCACGGGCPACGSKNSNLQISQPNDSSEIEADRIADKIMRAAEPENPSSTKNSVQRKESGGAPASLSRPAFDNLINSSPGRSLDNSTRSFMESRFNRDFGDVKIYDDESAAKSAKSVNALAYTAGNTIVFNSGQYDPNSYSGKRLLAHELAHVVQQDSVVRRKASKEPDREKGINITEELVDLPDPAGVPMLEPLPDDGRESSPELDTDAQMVMIQKAPDDAQPAAGTGAGVRKDLVFIMGTKGGFYAAAKVFFKQHHPEAEIVNLKDRSLSGIFAALRTKVSDAEPAGNIYIVSHANQDGTLSFPLHKADDDKKTGFGELKVALEDQADMFELNGGVDDKTFIHIKGCNIGRNTDMLNVLDEAFGGKDKVDAPTHRQWYEFETKKVDGKKVKVSRELFNKLVVEYPGKEEKSTEDLVYDFQEKYDAELDYDDHEWKMMVMGAKKYDASRGKEAKGKKSAIDKETKEKKKEVDKTDKDSLKALDQEAKTAKGEVDTWLKEMKTSKVARKSPGVKRNVVQTFVLDLYNGPDPSISLKKALPYGKAWAKANEDLKDFTVIECTSITPNADDPIKTDFKFSAKHKETGEPETLVFSPDIPKTDEEASPIADEAYEKSIGEKPKFEVAHKEKYAWRISTKKVKSSLKITAYLEMTQYTIDIHMREETGELVDPKAKEADDFYFGESTFE